MLLVKVWGSLIAPKDKKWIDKKYMQEISSIFNDFDDIFLTHWTWNIGHWWVKRLIENNPWKKVNELLIEDFSNWRKILWNYFNQIDEFFPWFKRILAENFLKEDKNIFWKRKFIIWWDVLSNWEIISSDDIVWSMMRYDFVDFVLILTDVDGVYDKNWNVIDKITKDNFKNIIFWEKENDVTGWMQQKVLKILNSWKKVVICNWRNIDNINNWILYKKWEGTIIE